MKTAFPTLPFIAEDLGYIDEAVRQAIERLGVPGMRVVLFAFDGDKNNPHLPKNHIKNAVVYTGTHDTNTARGWFATEASAKDKRTLFRVVGREVSEKEVSHELLRLALSSVADLSILPFQDVLGLRAEARMNNPSRSRGNWEWRVTEAQLQSPKLRALQALTVQYER